MLRNDLQRADLAGLDRLGDWVRAILAVGTRTPDTGTS